MNARLKLTIELVPSSVWYSSLYQLLPRNVWHRIKQEIYSKEGRKCYICGSREGRFSAHEFWEYDDKDHIQRLVAVHHLCNLCHKIKHIGFWCHTSDGKASLEREGLNREALIKHFCIINGCTKENFLEHEKKAFDMWAERSKHQWKQNFGEFAKYLNKTERSYKNAM